MNYDTYGSTAVELAIELANADRDDPAWACAFLGSHDDWFSPGELFANAYTISPVSNRVGARLAGPTLTRTKAGELPSEGVVLGAIQVPLNAYLKGQFLQYQLLDSQATALVCDAAGWRAAIPQIREHYAQFGDRLPAQLAMESGMACGFGACFGCVVPLRSGAVRDLRDGTVTTAAEGDGVRIQTCVNAAAGACDIDL